jgi:hypothetical protein
MADAEGTSQPDAGDAMKNRADGTTALGAIRGAAKNARFNGSGEVRGVVARDPRKGAAGGIRWRRDERLRRTLRRNELGELVRQVVQSLRNVGALFTDSISAVCSPCCGEYKLTRIRSTSGRWFQNDRYSSR